MSTPLRIGNTTSTTLILPNSSKIRRSSSPRPADFVIWCSAFHSTYAKRHAASRHNQASAYLLAVATLISRVTALGQIKDRHYNAFEFVGGHISSAHHRCKMTYVDSDPKIVQKNPFCYIVGELELTRKRRRSSFLNHCPIVRQPLPLGACSRLPLAQGQAPRLAQ